MPRRERRGVSGGTPGQTPVRLREGRGFGWKGEATGTPYKLRHARITMVDDRDLQYFIDRPALFEVGAATAAPPGHRRIPVKMRQRLKQQEELQKLATQAQQAVADEDEDEEDEEDLDEDLDLDDDLGDEDEDEDEEEGGDEGDENEVDLGLSFEEDDTLDPEAETGKTTKKKAAKKKAAKKSGSKKTAKKSGKKKR